MTFGTTTGAPMERPRVRVLANGWIRHDGGPMPSFLDGGVRINIAVRSGNAEFVQGHPARAYIWRHAGFSGDIIAWRPL